MIFFFFNDTATTEIYTLSLHDALPIFRLPLRVDPRRGVLRVRAAEARLQRRGRGVHELPAQDRKSTRLNSSHANISYAVFCLKKNKKPPHRIQIAKTRVIPITTVHPSG